MNRSIVFNRFRFCLVMVIAAIWLLSGCTAIRTFPNAARAGDTIALAVGSPDNLTISTIQSVTFQYNSGFGGAEVDLKPYVRSIFKLYADRASRVYSPGYPPTGLAAFRIIETSGHEPWTTIMVLDLPSTTVEPLLQPGKGQIIIRTVPGLVTYPSVGSDINDLQANGLRQNLEIIAGTGRPDLFEYEFGSGSKKTGNLGDLEPIPRVLVRPPFQEVSSFRTDLGAVEIKVDISSCNNKGTALTDADVRIVPDDLTPETASNRSVVSAVRTGDILDVIFLSTVGKLHYYEPRFSIILKDGLSTACNPWFFTNGGMEPGVAHYALDGTLIEDATVPLPASDPASPDVTTEYSVEVH